MALAHVEIIGDCAFTPFWFLGAAYWFFRMCIVALWAVEKFRVSLNHGKAKLTICDAQLHIGG